jgi:hypothetical protein
MEKELMEIYVGISGKVMFFLIFHKIDSRK